MLRSVVWILVALAAWGGLHSLTASLRAKALARRWVGQRRADGGYRLAYNVVSLVSFIPVLLLTATLPDRALYQLPRWVLPVSLPVQLAALAGMFISLWKVDLPRFLGIRQVIRWLRGKSEPRDTPTLNVAGIHRWVRHPLYFFSLILIWLTPLMTVNLLTFNVAVTLYFWIGSVFEERKLVREFGDSYREHQQSVPRLMPYPRPHSRHPG